MIRWNNALTTGWHFCVPVRCISNNSRHVFHISHALSSPFNKYWKRDAIFADTPTAAIDVLGNPFDWDRIDVDDNGDVVDDDDDDNSCCSTSGDAHMVDPLSSWKPFCVIALLVATATIGGVRFNAS
jgi:hypothetical protein